jgi:hypothetical protein
MLGTNRQLAEECSFQQSPSSITVLNSRILFFFHFRESRHKVWSESRSPSILQNIVVVFHISIAVVTGCVPLMPGNSQMGLKVET